MPDEAYYWMWSRQPGPGYFDHPPMVAWLIAASTAALGDGELGVRISAVLLSALAGWVVYLAGCEAAGSGRAGFLAAAAVSLAPFASVGGVIITPDTPLALFWAAATLFALRFMRTAAASDMLLLGFSCGLGLLSKYTMGLFLFGLFNAFLVSPAARKAFRRPAFYAAALLCVLLCLPVLAWNQAHGWASVAFQAGHGLHVASFAFKPRLMGEFLLGQAALVTPGVFAWALWFFTAGVIGARDREEIEKRRVLLWTSFLPFTAFLSISLFRRVEPNWPAPAYIGAVIGAVILLEKRASPDPRRSAARRNAVLATAAAFTAVVFAQASSPVIPLQYWNDPTSRLRGWEGAAAEVKGELDRLANETADGRAFMFTRNYQLASELNYYGRFSPPAWAVGETMRQSQYDFWKMPDLRPGASALYLTEFVNEDRPLFLKVHFDRCEPLRDVLRETGRGQEKLPLIECSGYK